MVSEAETSTGFAHHLEASSDEAEPLALTRAAPVRSVHSSSVFEHRRGHGGQYQQKHMVVFDVFDSKTERLSGEVLSISSERILKDRQAWRGGSLLMKGRKSGDTGDSHRGEQCRRFIFLTGVTLNSMVDQGCSRKPNFRAKSNKCQARVEKLRGQNCQKYPR